MRHTPIREVRHNYTDQDTEQDASVTWSERLIDEMEIDTPDLLLRLSETAIGPLSEGNVGDDANCDSLPVSPRAFGFAYCGDGMDVDKTDTPISQFFSFTPNSEETLNVDNNENDIDSEASTIVESGINSTNIVTSYANMVIERPIKLDQMPSDMLAKILSHVFPVSNVVRPWFRRGMSTHGTRGWSKNDTSITFKDNIDVAFLGVNQACYEIGTTILYGSNYFCFQGRSDCCVWWIRHIGDHNVQKVKQLSFRLNTGWRFDRRNSYNVPNPSEQCHEQEWFTVISKLRDVKVRLDKLEVSLIHWTDVRYESRYTDEDKEELSRYRKLVIDCLAKLRDVKEAAVYSWGEKYISEKEAHGLVLLMQQPGHTLVEEPAIPPMTLSQVVGRIKAEQRAVSRRVLDGHSCGDCVLDSIE